MATCGYVCPSCEGKTFLDDGSPCLWCQPAAAAVPVNVLPVLTDEEWIQSVHFGPCCGDREEEQAADNNK